MNESYLPLTKTQIDALAAQGCRAADWGGVLVEDGFDAADVHNVVFAGQVRIGAGAVIDNVRVRIKDCVVGRGARVEDVSILECSGSSSFGVGAKVAVINEGGGREVPLHTSMSAQSAYLIALWRHRGAAVEKLLGMIERERGEALSDMCRVGEGARVCGCGVLRDVNVGDHAVVTGAQQLENGTILSSADAPATVGHGVRAVDFIFSRSSSVDSGSSLRRCFVGQGCVIEEGFTAIDSLFFSNCIMAEGEAASVFAGPYTVSHHKATLLIAGLFSFFNAGSGANQSNHLFRTGAVHQGINERGCKFGSNAYIMLPARNGAFTTVLGSHYSHHDTSAFPYSLLVEQGERSFLLPAAAMRSWGLVRDLQKWPARDRRPASAAADIINFAPWNPYVASRVARALEIGKGLLANAGLDTYTYERVKIKSVMLRRGMQTYRLAMDAALGEMLSGSAEASARGEGEWIDLGGMFAPKSLVDALMDEVQGGDVASIPELRDRLEAIHARYAVLARGWALSHLGGEPEAEVAGRGAEAARTLEGYARDDADGDRTMARATGYGVDSQERDDLRADFHAVRGVEIKE